MKDSLFIIIKTMVWQLYLIRQVQTFYVDLETSQYPWDGSPGLGDANDRT